ncbi:MAG: ABC transporter permease subunit [Glaciimonas sp.]|nr:ABC transporter permease subunit [Glaciimonas sp.]
MANNVRHQTISAPTANQTASTLLAAALNVVFGGIVAWELVRYRFPGKKIIDALVDLPFALPTAVAGIALTALYAPNGWIGRFLEPPGIKVAFTPPGVLIALTFIGLPFVVHTVQPVLEDAEHELEEAAASLGAHPLQTFSRVIFPTILPALMTGFALAFLTLFLFVPLLSVFAEAFKKGWQAYLAAVTEPDAVSAIKLTVLTAAIAVRLNLVFGVASS